jgi:hypothetical protein
MGWNNMNATWWGKFEFSLSSSRTWHIGDRWIGIQRKHTEWTITNATTATENAEPLRITTDDLDAETDADITRYMVNETSDTLVIEPTLADRSVIVRPGKPLVIQPMQTMRIYISTPLWFTVLLPDSEVPIADIPFWRPSDSWFGPSPMNGDICYAKYTDARNHQESIEPKPNRATTLVTLENKQNEPLLVERINVPVTLLKLYVDEANAFWTDDVVITQYEENGKSLSRVDHTMPSFLTVDKLVSESRQLSQKKNFISSIKNLIA